MGSKGTSGVPAMGGPKEAEEFMALLLLAQKESEHDCAFINYFRKLGDRMLGEYAGGEN